MCGSGTRHRDHVRVQTATEFAIFKAHMWTWICGELLVDTLAMRYDHTYRLKHAVVIPD